LSPEKVAALERIDFDWGTRKGIEAWNLRYRELEAYKAEYGDCKCIFSASDTLLMVIGASVLLV